MPDSTVNIKILPENKLGTYPLSSASYISITTASRALRPYPPGNLRMQGQPYGTRLSTIVGDLSLTWSARNLNSQIGGPLIPQDQGDIALPPSVGYEVQKFINGTDVGAHIDTGGVGAATITADQRAVMSVLAGPNDAPLTVYVFSFLNILPASLFSRFAQRLDVIFTGFGMCFGEYFGGIQQ